ncbi:hypothetical protein EVAR_34398_1 [Eumeta japonica]|uniref:Uncharacterized protein n=1 Tax=Eumeta variegata TaxID=151549 RepID=A0A4C1WZP6_EUMVA|nr:hypothetical protein EVAR_34398_1 [Eumeta japonica]
MRAPKLAHPVIRRLHAAGVGAVYTKSAAVYPPRAVYDLTCGFKDLEFYQRRPSPTRGGAGGASFQDYSRGWVNFHQPRAPPPPPMPSFHKFERNSRLSVYNPYCHIFKNESMDTLSRLFFLYSNIN